MNTAKEISLGVFVISFCSYIILCIYEARAEIVGGIARNINKAYLGCLSMSWYGVLYWCLGVTAILSFCFYMLSNCKTEEEK